MDKTKFVLKDLSIIIVNYRSWDKLSHCLDSLASISESYFTFEVIVVDNFSGDGKISYFRQIYPRFTFLLNEGNYGFSNGNNLGASASRGKYLLFLNPDTIISEKALHAMLDQAKVSRANSIISCRQVKENGTEDKPYGIFPSPMSLTGWTRALTRFLNKNGSLRQNERFIFPDWVSGSIMMMSKTSFNTIGKWNERFWMYFEDVDFCRRASELNGVIFLLKSVAVVHLHGGSSRLDSEIAALTKTEVNISRHEYISLNETGLKEVLIHVFLILNNLIFGFISAVPGLFLFFNKRLFTVTKAYAKLLNYYFNAFLHDTWISPRSVMHPESYQLVSSTNKKLVTIGDNNN